MWRAWYDANEVQEESYPADYEDTYDQTRPDMYDEETWQSMTLSQTRVALEEQGRQVLGRSEREAYDQCVRESQQEAEDLVQLANEGIRRRNMDDVDPGTPDSTEARTQS